MKAYSYDIRDCNVVDKVGLHSFRQKRAQWSDWLDGDPDHAIWNVVCKMVWRDTTFTAISKLALENPEGPLNATLLGEAIVGGHVTMQVLALRRLTDRRSDVISLHRLIQDIKSHWHLLTRENFVCFDALPYEYDIEVDKKNWEGREPGVAYWGEVAGPRAFGTAERFHRQFDRLAGIAASNRTRTDVLPRSLIEKVEGWLLYSGAEEIAKWSHPYLAHAGNSRDREAIAHIQLTNDKIATAIRDVARVTEALSGEILWIGGRTGALMPVAQYDVFERLDRPVASERQRAVAEDAWRSKSNEWDNTLRDVRDVLSEGAVR